MASPPSVPTSRAFWDLKAEQVMDRVFANGANRTSVALLDHTPIDVVVSEAPPRAPAPPPPSRATRTATPTSFWQHPWLLVIAALALVGLTSSLLLWRNWQVANRALDQERNLKLLERLRDLVPAAAEPVALPAGQGAGAVATPDPSLPPPPLEEPWVQELAPLSGGTAGRLPPRGPCGCPSTAPSPGRPPLPLPAATAGRWVTPWGAQPAPNPLSPRRRQAQAPARPPS